MQNKSKKEIKASKKESNAAGATFSQFKSKAILNGEDEREKGQVD